MKVNHIGYAVKRLDRALASFVALGYVFEEAIEDADRNVQLAFGEKDGYRIELVCPMDKTKESPVDSYLSSVGPTPYHICYESSDIDAIILALSKKGFRAVIPPAPAVAFDGKRVVFMTSLGTGLIEIVEA